MPAHHPLASRRSVRFAQTLDVEHVGLPPATAVYTMLHRAAAQSGRNLSYRVIVSNFDAALRVVSAGLGISVIPMQVSALHVPRGEIQVIPLTDAWAQRRFAICFREQTSLAPAAARMVEFLADKAAGYLGATTRSRTVAKDRELASAALPGPHS